MSRDKSDHKPLLKDVVTKHVTAAQLDEKQLQQLMDMQQSINNNPKKSVIPPVFNDWRYSGLAVCVFSALVFVALLLRPSSDVKQDYIQQIAFEVVKNHLKLKPLDVKAQSITEVQQFFTLLDFSPVNSLVLEDTFRLSESSMLGGRYCSIKGVTAAQLRYRNNESEMSTLYEVPYDPAVFGEIPSADNAEQPQVVFVKGLKVSMWVEKGLLLVLVDGAD